ncbi:MAG TPA: isoprenylcysteine carboxylmethyltransferase family protein [Gammaproteobacteria bacterium]|nr:isoprenylcysteine carboxylmethyltransferase family protein [Gammaproteobacteria bacterium]
MIYSITLIWLTGVIFAVSHSLLATNKGKQIAYQVGLSSQAYRLGYVILAILSTLLWLTFVHSLPDTALYSLDAPYAWALRGIQLLGVLLFWASLQPIDSGVFLGLKKFPDGIEPFIESGVYRYIRHPMYSSAMLIMFAMPQQSVNSINLYLVISLYFIIGARFEENRLLLTHPEYSDYRQKVAAFIPRMQRKACI